MTGDQQVIRDLIEAWNSRGLDAWLDFIDPECTMVTDPNWPDGGQMTGRAEIERFTRDFAAHWESIRLREADPEPIGDRWLFKTAWEGRGRQSDVDVGLEFTAVARVGDGRIRELRLYLEHEDAVREAGRL